MPAMKWMMYCAVPFTFHIRGFHPLVTAPLLIYDSLKITGSCVTDPDPQKRIAPVWRSGFYIKAILKLEQ